MKFPGLGRLTEAISPQTKSSFSKIQGYDDVKEIVKRALNAEDNFNLIFVGAPSSGKTLFLQGIMDICKGKDVVYFDATNTTNKILDILESARPKIICLDELEKMPKQFQEKLLGLLESGRVDVEQQKKQYHFEIKGMKAFATCNDVGRLSKPLQSRFRKIFLPKYSESEFLNVCEKVLPKLSPSIARYIGNKVYSSNGDIRSVHVSVKATNESSFKYGYSAGRDIVESGKAYELGLPECSSTVVNPEVTNASACYNGYENAYNHFVSKRWEQRTPSEDLFSYQQGWKTGTHDYDCSFYGGQQSSSSMGNGVRDCSNVIQNVCNVDYKLNTTNATSCFSGYVEAFKTFYKFNLTSCDTTLNQLLAGHSPTYWAAWQNGKGDGENGHFDVGGSIPANITEQQQRVWYSGYYTAYDRYCTKGDNKGDDCPAIPFLKVGDLIPDQDKSQAYNSGFSSGFTGKPLVGHHTQNYTKGYDAGSSMYLEIKGVIIPGYLDKPMIKPPSSLDKNQTSDYLGWYKQAKHFHMDDGFTIIIPSHTNDNYFAYYEGIQDGMLVYDQDNNRENGNSPCPLGHLHEKEYCLGFNDGGSIEHQAEDAD